MESGHVGRPDDDDRAWVQQASNRVAVRFGAIPVGTRQSRL